MENRLTNSCGEKEGRLAPSERRPDQIPLLPEVHSVALRESIFHSAYPSPQHLANQTGLLYRAVVTRAAKQYIGELRSEMPTKCKARMKTQVGFHIRFMPVVVLLIIVLTGKRLFKIY
ncbi:UNVERIFIED_CONTAM: hypothetical protein K2H54_015277 [Gekko kuhli]